MTKTAKNASTAKPVAEKTTITLYTTRKDILQAATAWGTSMHLAQNEAHKLACSVLKHYAMNQDKRVVLAFLNAVPDMVRTNSLKSWFEMFGSMKFIDDDVQFVKEKKTRLGEAMDKPFWKFKSVEGVAYQPLDIKAYIAQQIKRIEADIAKVPAVGAEDERKRLLMALKGYAVPGVEPAH